MSAARVEPGSRRLLSPAMLLALSASAACACSAPDRSQIALELWAMGREGEVVRELIPEFERTHPGIRVDVQQLPWTAAHEKLLTAFVGDATPDIAQLGNTWVAEFSALGAIAPLDAEVAASTVVERDDYFAGIWDTNQIAGALYGVPWYVDTRLLFYRRDIVAEAGFAQPPRTWAEWLEVLTAVKRHVGPERYAIFLPLNEFEPLLALALQQPDGLLRDGDRFGNFRSPGYRRTLEFYIDMFRKDLAPVAAGHQMANLWDEFGRGLFSFYITGPWNIGEFKRRLPAHLQHVWMTAPLPGEGGPGASIAGGSSLVVFERSRNKQAAWQLIEYLSRPEVQKRFYGLTGDLPPRRESWSDERLAGDQYARAFRDQLERVVPSPKVPEWERIANEMLHVVEAAVHTRRSVDDTVADLDARTDAILEKRRWMLAREDEP